MKKFALGSLAVAAAIAVSQAALADSFYSFNFSDNDITVSGEFVTSDAVIPSYPGAQQILSFTGTITDTNGGGAPWNGAVSLYSGTAFFNTPDFNGVDNWFHPTGNGSIEGASGFQYFDGGGLVLSVIGGNDEWSIFGEGGGTYGNYPGTGGDGYRDYVDGVPGSDLSISAPDGGTTLALLGLAIAGLAGLRRKLRV